MREFCVGAGRTDIFSEGKFIPQLYSSFWHLDPRCVLIGIEINALNILGNALSALLKQKEAVAVYTRALDSLMALPLSTDSHIGDAMVKYLCCSLYVNLGNQYQKEGLFDKTEDLYNRAEACALDAMFRDECAESVKRSKLQFKLTDKRTTCQSNVTGALNEIIAQADGWHKSGKVLSLPEIADIRMALNGCKDAKKQWLLSKQITDARIASQFGNTLGEECPVCLESFADETSGSLHLTMCWHLIHAHCFSEITASNVDTKSMTTQESKCPVCRNAIVAPNTIQDQNCVIVSPRGPVELTLPVRDGRVLHPESAEYATIIRDALEGKVPIMGAERQMAEVNRCRFEMTVDKIAVVQGILSDVQPRCSPESAAGQTRIDLGSGCMEVPLPSKLWTKQHHADFISRDGLGDSFRLMTGMLSGLLRACSDEFQLAGANSVTEELIAHVIYVRGGDTNDVYLDIEHMKRILFHHQAVRWRKGEKACVLPCFCLIQCFPCAAYAA